MSASSRARLRCWRSAGAITPGFLCLMALLVASPAHAEAPWWHLSSGARPAYLHAGVGTPGSPGEEEVQEVEAKLVEFEGHPTNGFVLQVGHVELGQFVTEPLAAQLGPEFTALSAAKVQAALEGPYGKGAVHVTEETVGEVLVLRVHSHFGSPPIELGSEGFEPSPKVSVVNPGKAEVPPTGYDELYVTAENVGDGPVRGASAAVQLKDVLPEGLRAVGIAATRPHAEGDFHHREPISCTLATLTCTLEEELVPYDQIEMRIAVEVQPGARTGALNEVSISGGGALPARTQHPITISTSPVPFGIESYEVGLEEEGGLLAAQAGVHPFQLTATLELNQLADINPLVTPPEYRPEVASAGLVKDLSMRLPPGLVASPSQIPRCTITQFFEAGESENRCPPDTAVGVAVATVHEPTGLGTATLVEPVFNLEPHAGEPARFGFYVAEGNEPVLIDTALRSGGDYGVTVSIENVTQTAGLLSSEITLWGVPGDPRHDGQRGWGCLAAARGARSAQSCTPSQDTEPPPLISLPTSCRSAMKSSILADSWAAPESPVEVAGEFSPEVSPGGCDRLQFDPQIAVTPDAQQASRPMGLGIDVHVPPQATAGTDSLAPSAIRTIEVALPQGVAVNPSLADGLQTCSEGEVGLLSGQGEEGESLFTPALPQPFCPDASKIGTARITSPLLPGGQTLEGALYLATPAPGGEAGENPFNALVAMYVVAQDPLSGVLVKLSAWASLDPGTGRMTKRFGLSPQIPIEDVQLDLFGGERAALAAPARCGTYTTEATFEPWSGTPVVKTDASFQILSGPGGGLCPGTDLPFAPSLAAGTSDNRAGAFSPLAATISRKDGDQEIKALQLRLPAGVSGVLRGVPACAQAQAEGGTCTASSLLGHTVIGIGVGADPLAVAGGEVFLTDGYEGAPFGLSIVSRAIAGPFDLGRIVIRAKLEFDPRTAGLVVSTEESGPYAIPRILDGIPLQVRYLSLLFDRPHFVFNPTSCSAKQIGGTIEGAEGANVELATPFQATGCTHLKFSPTLEVSTSGKTSRTGGASLHVKLAAAGGPASGYANLAKVVVSLPKQLSARLTTLQRACGSRVFAEDSSKCPGESLVGGARLQTPLLPAPLAGPVYFVSHGSKAFPELTLLLHGDGVTVELAGSTQIKNGITSSTFAVPDVPIGSFELSLPRGKHSVLGANANLCSSTLFLSAQMRAQNGAQAKRRTRIQVTGCRKARGAERSLSEALAVCRRVPARRRACEARARRLYGASRRKVSRG